MTTRPTPLERLSPPTQQGGWEGSLYKGVVPTPYPGGGGACTESAVNRALSSARDAWHAPPPTRVERTEAKLSISRR